MSARKIFPLFTFPLFAIPFRSSHPAELVPRLIARINRRELPAILLFVFGSLETGRTAQFIDRGGPIEFVSTTYTPAHALNIGAAEANRKTAYLLRCSARMGTEKALEVGLMRIMVALVVRYPDGLDRIQSAYRAVVEAGEELADEDGAGIAVFRAVRQTSGA